MAKSKPDVDSFIKVIRDGVGHSEANTARSLLDFANEIGADRLLQKRTVSVGLQDYRDRHVLHRQTLYLISEAGTFYIGWYDHWQNNGVAAKYNARLTELLGRVSWHPSKYKSAVPLAKVAMFLNEVKTAIWAAVKGLRDDDSAISARSDKAAATSSAIENTFREARYLRRKRNQRLRTLALARAAGVCEVCDRDFGIVLGGKGLRALQVHHRNQLSATDEPVLTSEDELAVVCANCHALIHYDQSKAIPVEELRLLLSKDIGVT